MRNFLPFFGVSTGLAIGRTFDKWAAGDPTAIYPTIILSVTLVLGILLTIIESKSK